MSVRLPRLPSNWATQPQLFERYWDEILNQLETTLNAILDIPLIQQAVLAAQNAANTAQAAANSAQIVAVNQMAESSLVNSYGAVVSGGLISAASNGDVTVQTHTRTYGNSGLNPAVSVTGAVIATGAAAGSFVRVYYDDPARAGGTVSYLFTVDPAAPPVQTGSRHVVGAVQIPTSGTKPGKSIQPPGYIDQGLLL